MNSKCKRRKLASLFFFLVFVMGAFAQNPYYEVEEDFGLWTEIVLKKKWSKKWSSDLVNSFRFQENASQFQSFFTELSIDRDLKKKWAVGVNNRYTVKALSEGYRFSFYVTKELRFKPINIRYRFKTDLQWDLTTFKQNNDEQRIRNRIGLEYARKKHRLSGGLYAEWFHPVDKDLFLPSDIRYKLASSYKISKSMDVKLAYIIQQELNAANPNRDYILATAIKFDF